MSLGHLYCVFHLYYQKNKSLELNYACHPDCLNLLALPLINVLYFGVMVTKMAGILCDFVTFCDIAGRTIEEAEG